jgi:hypothetical protein
MNPKIKTGIIFFIVFAIYFFACHKTTDKDKNSESQDNENSTVELNASIEFTGTQFIITNKDTFDYIDAKLQLNNDFIIKGETLEAGESYTVGMLQFADKQGNRFDAMKKPQNFSIWCDLKNEKKGFYYAEWK